MALGRATAHRHIDTSSQLGTTIDGLVQIAGDRVLDSVQARYRQAVLARMSRCPDRRPRQSCLRFYHGDELDVNEWYDFD